MNEPILHYRATFFFLNVKVTRRLIVPRFSLQDFFCFLSVLHDCVCLLLKYEIAGCSRLDSLWNLKKMNSKDPRGRVKKECLCWSSRKDTCLYLCLFFILLYIRSTACVDTIVFCLFDIQKSILTTFHICNIRQCTIDSDDVSVYSCNLPGLQKRHGS